MNRQFFESLNKDICFSGGAKGADLTWGDAASKNNHMVIHWCFQNQTTFAKQEQKIILDKEQLESNETFLKETAKELKRYFPANKPYVANLLRRNYWQICFVDSVYAVGFIENNEITGGTAWAVTMAKLKGVPFRYIFDQHSNKWFKIVGTAFEETIPPKPTGLYAGIGSRELQQNGKDAIYAIFEK